MFDWEEWGFQSAAVLSVNMRLKHCMSYHSNNNIQSLITVIHDSWIVWLLVTDDGSNILLKMCIVFNPRSTAQSMMQDSFASPQTMLAKACLNKSVNHYLLLKMAMKHKSIIYLYLEKLELFMTGIYFFSQENLWRTWLQARVWTWFDGMLWIAPTSVLAICTLLSLISSCCFNSAHQCFCTAPSHPHLCGVSNPSCGYLMGFVYLPLARTYLFHP